MRIRERFNPHAPCGARPFCRTKRHRCRNFNPRAPCGARPLYVVCSQEWSLYFNPRAPCGARPEETWLDSSYDAFQPTRPLRGATRGDVARQQL